MSLSDLTQETSPQLRAAYQEESDKLARSVQVSCAWGSCMLFWDPLTNRAETFFGPVGCPCDHLPGWRARYLEAMPKPRVPVKTTGRHGSRVQRSRRRHELPFWLLDLA